MKRRAFLRSLAATVVAGAVKAVPTWAAPLPKMKITRVHAPHSPVPQSPPLLEAYLPRSSSVEQAVRAQLARA